MAIAVYVLSGYDSNAAASYVYQYNTSVDAKALVEQWFLESSDDFLAALCDPGLSDERSVHDAAMRWVSDVRTAQWVSLQNFQTGVAPSSSSMASHHAGLLGRAAPSSGKPVRRWACAFRKNWQIRFGKLGSGHEMPLDEVQEKAGPWS